MSTELHLGGTPLQWMYEVEYLGLRLRKEGFLGKKLVEVENKCKAALHLLTNENWLTLDIEPKHILSDFNSRVRSQMIYGAEILSFKERQPFVDADRLIVNMFIIKLLKLGKEIPLHQKHQIRTQVAFGI